MRPLRHAFQRRVHTRTDETRDRLRELLRETAQSVAVVTAILPASDTAVAAPTYHGATLSSFSSVALDPLPLVAFSLRVPSRMASALNTRAASSRATPRTPAPCPCPPADLIVHVLSAAQPHLAERFARPDLYPRPFADPCVGWSLSRDGLPVLAGALGALACRLVGPSLPLAHLPLCGDYEAACAHQARRVDRSDAPVQQASGGTGLASELFIASVLSVERMPPSKHDGGLHTLPLLYHRRRYTTVQDPAES